MRTMYYVVAGGRYFGFYVDDGKLAIAKRGENFRSLTEVLDWAAEHQFDRAARCEPEQAQPVSREGRMNGRNR